MAHPPDNPDAGAGRPGGNGPQEEPFGPPPEPGSQAGRKPVQIQIDDSQAVTTYANFCRVSGTPEELFIDFGVNPQPVAGQNSRLAIQQRIVTNYYTAKRLLQVLGMTIQRHEATFGVLETDVQKRVRPGAGRPPQSP